MIVKGLRVRHNASLRLLANHLFRGNENESVSIVQGTEADLRDAFDDCRKYGRTYALRHWILAPAVEVSRETLVEMAKILESVRKVMTLSRCAEREA